MRCARNWAGAMPKGISKRRVVGLPCYACTVEVRARCRCRAMAMVMANPCLAGRLWYGNPKRWSVRERAHEPGAYWCRATKNLAVFWDGNTMVNRALKRYKLVYSGLEISFLPFRHKTLCGPLRFVCNDVGKADGDLTQSVNFTDGGL